MNKVVPEVLSKHILPFNWDVNKLWLLDCDSVLADRKNFDYLLNLPLWSSKPNIGMLFDISPMEVIESNSISPHQYERVINADLNWPIDVLKYDGRIWVLDGVHRIAKAYINKVLTMSVRIHDTMVIPLIKKC